MGIEIWSWKPCISVGPLRFGMGRQNVRNILKISFKEFGDSKYSQNTGDNFSYFRVHYNAGNKLDFIEFFDNIQITYNGKIIFPCDVNTITNFISSLKVDSELYVLYDYGKQIKAGYNPNDGQVNTLSFARSNYWRDL